MTTDLGARTRDHYERYPYPASATLDWSPDEWDRLNFFLGRGAAERLPADGRVLVAGCGTREAVQWALQAPDAEVVGIDFSAESLARTRRLAEALGVANLTLREADIMRVDADALGGPFDLVVTFGVVHHLADPQEGLRRLAGVLAPGGALLLMVYSTTHRRPVRELDRLAALLCPADAPAEARVERIVQLAEDAADFPGPLRDTLRNVLEFSREDVPALMDTYGHPNYHTYTVDELWALLAGAGLRFASWARPGEWRAGNYLPDGPLVDAIGTLPAAARFDWIDRVFAPLFVLYAEPARRAPSERPYDGDDDALLDLVVRPSGRVRVTFDTAGRPGAPIPYGPSVRVVGGVATISFHAAATYECHPLIVRVLQRLDGQTSLRAAAASVAEEAGAPPAEVASLVADAARALLSPHEAIVPVG